VENASVEFDVATLRPTYRLSIGIPGKSNAFEISRKLGLPSGLIQSAQELLSKETIQFEDVIANAEYHRQVAQKERAMAKEMYEEAALMRRNMEKLQQEIEEKHRGADKKAKEEAKKIIDKAKRESTAILAELRLMHKSGDARSHEVNALSRRLNDASDVLSDALNFSPQTNRLSAGNISVGDSVSLADLGASATVLTLPDTKGELQIQAGIIKMKVHVSQLSKDETPDKKRPATSVHAQTGGKRASLECDVRGLSLDEALMEVDNYLDTAVMNGLESVSIIHGKGTGVLRAGIQKHLKSIPQVKSFRLGNYGEGESGVTMVTLK
jgi:DNA mismatch repair protein MutS2